MDLARACGEPLAILTGGFLNDEWQDSFAVVSLVGVGLTFVGVLVALYQTRRTRTSAEAAQKAAASARRQLSENLLISEVTSANRRIGEIRLLLQGAQYSLVGLRLNDLRESLVELGTTVTGKVEERGQFQAVVAQISLLETELIERELNPDKPFDIVLAHQGLQQVSNFLTQVAQEAKLKAGGADANS